MLVLLLLRGIKMRGKRYTKYKTRSNSSKLILLLILLFFLTMMFVSGVKIYQWISDNLKNKSIANRIQDSISMDVNSDNSYKYNIDFSKLKQDNPDAIAWIKVNNTNIEYPIVKSTDNNYYLTHSFDKSYNSAGWIFADYRNRIDNKDKNIIIYGHNRRDGSMFGSLKNILTSEWQNNKDNYKIPFITENEKSEYQVFSVYKIENEDYYTTTGFSNDEEFQAFINKIKSRSEKDFGVEVSSNDKIITLSTCADNNKYRVVLHAKKIE